MQARDHDRTHGAAIVRLASWATAAAIALFIAALAGLTPGGSERVDAALAALTGGEIRASQQPSRQAEIESDRRSFNEAIRILAADRDRLVARVNSLERTLDDITGSIRGQIAATPPPELSNDRPTNVPAASPAPSPASEITPESPLPPSAPSIRVTALPAQAQPTPPTATSRTDFGVDIGSAADVKALRSLWKTAKTRHGPLLGSLRPIVVRGEDQAGVPDYRLVVGPFTNAGDAVKLCAMLGAGDVTCSIRPYRGERLTP